MHFKSCKQREASNILIVEAALKSDLKPCKRVSKVANLHNIPYSKHPSPLILGRLLLRLRQRNAGLKVDFFFHPPWEVQVESRKHANIASCILLRSVVEREGDRINK